MGRVDRLGALAVFLACAACTKAPAPTIATPAPEQDKVGRFKITPAGTGPMIIGGHPYLSAWRLDTKTGDLELCTFDPDPPTIGKLPAPQLGCSNRDEASAREP